MLAPWNFETKVSERIREFSRGAGDGSDAQSEPIERQWKTVFRALNGSFMTQSLTNYEDVTAIPQLQERVAREYTLNSGDLSETLQMAVDGGRAPTLLIGPTGCGKSTKLPMELAALVTGSVLHVLPTMTTLVCLYDYVSGRHRSLCSADFGADSVPTTKVIYTTAHVFAYRIMQERDPYAHVSAVILDEAHDTSAVYMALKAYLAAKGGAWYVFYVTATYGNQDAEFERRGHRIGVREIEPVDLHRYAPTRGFLRASEIKGRVLYFLPDEWCFESVERYYEANGVQVIRMTLAMGPDTFRRIIADLEGMAGYTVVILADNCVEYGVTLPIDAVVDAALVPNLVYDAAAATLSYGHVPITALQYIQRQGRVGRLASGMYYFMKRPFSEPEEVNRPTRFLTYTWLVALGLRPMASYDRVGSFLGRMSVPTARTVIQCSIFPLAVTCLINGHKVFANYAVGLGCFASGPRRLPVSEAAVSLSTGRLEMCGGRQRHVPIAFGNDSVIDAVIRFLEVNAMAHVPARVGRQQTETVVMLPPITFADVPDDQFETVPELRPTLEETLTNTPFGPIGNARFHERRQRVADEVDRRNMQIARDVRVPEPVRKNVIQNPLNALLRTSMDSDTEQVDTTRVWVKRGIRYTFTTDLSGWTRAYILASKQDNLKDYCDMSASAVQRFQGLALNRTTTIPTEPIRECIQDFVRFWNGLQAVATIELTGYDTILPKKKGLFSSVKGRSISDQIMTLVSIFRVYARCGLYVYAIENLNEQEVKPTKVAAMNQLARVLGQRVINKY